ncbi:MAG: MFS transporter [Lachnospiraceae bacterium]|uniref:MFS transporter n=1 Tax=Candidatus Enterocloster excrementigallinarum TaxID=2838558 RepID=A0A9D2PX28_9FIRM|nr:MFS transporter [Lachnospiraceae bacterium]HJC67838.1 MFS transporter [Candidatus Enterocloster excrementigallinarum]
MFQMLLLIIYLAFISLGLPDSLLGSAWPSMYQDFSVPVSSSGIVFMIISLGTIISSLQSDRLTKRFGTGKITAVSVLMTAAALFGFSISRSFPALCLWAIPYGLGAGSVDASLNNYVALHYASRHMSWLHCMWGVGASLGPYIMGYALTGGYGWSMGYRIIAVIQILLTAFLFLSLSQWKNGNSDEGEQRETTAKALSLGEILRIPGAKEVMVTFFCYCALEQTANLWVSSYLVLQKGITPEQAAGFASLFFVGITAGRFFSGFLTIKLGDTQMIRLGQAIILLGILTLLMPFGLGTSRIGLLLIGLGCAPVYPSIIHSTPASFGADKSQAMIGVQMAFAYVGTCLMPPLFGVIANHITAALFPFYLLIILGVMIFAYERMLSKVRQKRQRQSGFSLLF